MTTREHAYRRRLATAAAIAAAIHLVAALLFTLVPFEPDAGTPGVLPKLLPLDSLPTIVPRTGTVNSGGQVVRRDQHGRARTATDKDDEQAAAQQSLPTAQPNTFATAPSGGVPVASSITDTGRRIDLPGGRTPFTSKQDTTYQRGLRTRVTRNSRFHNDLQSNDSAWAAEQRRRSNETESIIRQNLTFTPEELTPTQHQRDNIEHQRNPGRPQNISPNIPRAGISIPFSMGRLLGTEPDVSPEFTYTIRTMSHVVVRVLGMDGEPIKVMFDGTQAAGSHTMTWDGHTDTGGRAPAGDYIVEVIADQGRVFAKWVRVG